MNLYRIFYRNRHNELLVKRDKLIEKLSGKRTFTDGDLKRIMDFKGVGHKEEYKNVNAESTTSSAFSTETIDEKFMILRRLRGIGMVMASAILMFQNPFKHAIIDTHAWNLLVENFNFSAEKKKPGADFTVKEYEAYLDKLAYLAEEFGMKACDVEFVLFLIDKKLAE